MCIVYFLRRCLLLHGHNLWLYAYKIILIPILQNSAQNFTVLDVVEVCSCDCFYSGNMLIFSADLVTGVCSRTQTQHDQNSTPLPRKFSPNHKSVKSLLIFTLASNLLYDRMVWTFSVSKIRDCCKNRR